MLVFGVVGVVVLTVGAGGYLYFRLNANIQHAPLFAGEEGDAGHEVPDAFGRTPINVLVIGSDSRANPEDCTIGGACGEGANADVNLLLHVAADRSNATVMSIPRDLVTDLPGCRNEAGKSVFKARRDMINSTLQGGPGCTVAAVRKLTDLPIDHFVQVDFSGVIKMSDAVGGVPVCVTENVYDPYSHLKLAKGTHTLQGMAALQFVRTRHGFGDGSDIRRASAQHDFLASMVRQLKSAGTLTDPGRLLSLADAATKALTVDPGLAGVTKLIGLGEDVQKVPSERITFTTMQVVEDPADTDRRVIGPNATQLFRMIRDDRPLTGDPQAPAAAPGPSATATATATAATAPATASSTPPAAGPARGSVTVVVRNGTGVTGRAGAVADALRQAGFGKGTAAGPAVTAARSAVTYPAGKEAAARQVADALGLPADAVRAGQGASVELLIGTDWPSGTAYPAAAAGAGTGGGGASSGGSAPAKPAADPSAALKGADALTADDSSGCTKVGDFKTVELPGYRGSMTPVQAFDRSKDVPVSAP
ncbi:MULTISPECIES: LCP family protein [Kitasatospora]|uniref:Putative lytR family regulatory protein n=1 Tax=Kitasatospora setae (strain ATCC 33774 / DSM 43861 / JCM 3304 / KCC A-0304 / NBRC 14216 / KM-6054) TaxID=452652 RepID=E4MZS5_KITSK|nr:LCP family protein [Kitasatospora setae]BAJ30009.1 putative lytR family regulatory protein [Kitasatospora setae KM-6054]